MLQRPDPEDPRLSRPVASLSQSDGSACRKISYTKVRLNGERVIENVITRISVLLSRSGFAAWGVELARKAGLTLVGLAKGSRFVVLSGAERVVSNHGAKA